MADDKKTLELQIRIAAGEALKVVSSLKGEMSSLAAEARKLSEANGEDIKRTFAETQAAAERAAASMKLFGVSSGELRQAQAQVKAAAVELVTKGFDPQSEEIKKLTEEYRRLEKEADDLDRATGKNTASFGDLKNALSSLAQVAALTKAVGVIKDMGAFALSTADTFQIARNEFGILLGDMEAGAGLFNEVKAFNDTTPFSLDTLTGATKVLLTAKVPLADLQKELTKFGDLSQGNSQKFTSYIAAFSKAAARGKADMETLNTYINQGVPILGALGKQFGVLEDEIVEMVSQGKIGFEDFSAALTELAAEGGQYFGGMELGSRSLAAMQEGLKESVNSLAASFGEMLLPAAIKIVKALTDIADAINDNPLLKGALAGALVAIAGYLAAMAIKAGIAFAAQMSLNLAIGALNPVVMAATLVVAGLAAGYVMYAADLQKAERETENFALEQRRQADTLNNSADALRRYSRALGNMADVDMDRNTLLIQGDIDAIEAGLIELEGAYRRAAADGRENAAAYWADIIAGEKEQLERARKDLTATLEEIGRRRTGWIDSMFGNTQAGKIQKVNDQLATANRLLASLGVTDGEKIKLNQIIGMLSNDLDGLIEKSNDASRALNEAAAAWKDKWTAEYARFQAENSFDPFALINLEEAARIEDARKQGIGPLNQRYIDEILAYYAAKRTETANQLRREEERMMWELSETRVDDLEWELREALNKINILEERRLIAAAGSEIEITNIRKHAAAMRAEIETTYAKEIADAMAEELQRATEASADPMSKRLETARQGIADWGQALSDTLASRMIELEWFGDKAAVILGDLAAQFAQMGANVSLDIFEEFGRAIALAADEEYSFKEAMAEMSQQLLRQLPMMFLQAGLQLVATPGQWPLGLGLIAAAGSTALLSGYVDGVTSKAKENAKGGVYDEIGRAAREYAAGGAFTNQIVSRPTYFRYGGGLGVMGEAGPEAIIPLTRGSDGRLGVSATGAVGGGTAVYVIIQNYSGEDVQTEESSDSSGNQIHKVIIGAVKQGISSGEMDQSMSSRYGLRARGV